MPFILYEISVGIPYKIKALRVGSALRRKGISLI